MAHDSGSFEGIAITQIGVVVRDVKKMVEIYHQTLGWGPWNIYIAEPPLLHSTMLRGKPTEFTFMNAETHVGLGTLDHKLIVGATLAGYEATPDNVTKLVALARMQAAAKRAGSQR